MTAPLSPAAERIARLALQQFAEQGYDAASLNDIASDAGIRKPSLYAHFASKDALYTAVLTLALQAEHDYVAGHFAQAPAAQAAWAYAEALQARYREHASLRFLLRAAFYPPPALRAAIVSGFTAYLADLRQRLLTSTAEQALPDSAQELLAEAWLALLDSLHVELIYGDDGAYRRRFDALRRLGLLDPARLRHDT